MTINKQFKNSACAVMIITLFSGASSITLASDSENEAFSIEEIEINRINGLINVAVKRLKNTGRDPVEVEIKYADVNETVSVRRGGVRTTKNATSKIPFPCNENHKVTATVVSPVEYAGIKLTEKLDRRCIPGRYSGTPNLVVLDLKRTDFGQGNSIHQTGIKVKVAVANIEPYGMPNNEQGGTPWQVTISREKSPRHGKIRQALPGKSKNERSQSHIYSFATKLNLNCWSREDDKYETVKVKVDSGNRILESNENDNEKEFEILKDRCRDAG